MILIGLGGNIPFPETGSPRSTCGAALDQLTRFGIRITRRSQWYESAPVPVSEQPWYVNGVVTAESSVSATDLVDILLETELRFGRRRDAINAPRTLDLDLIAYGDAVIDTVTTKGHAVNVPHPRMNERAFVLLPLRDIAPDWRHPSLGLSVDRLIEAMPAGQETRLMADAEGVYGTEWVARTG